MPTKNRRAPRRAQVKNAKQTAKQQSKSFQDLQRDYRDYRRALEKEKKAAARARDKEYKGILQAAAATGLYKPKSNELTPYRRKRAREVKQQFGQYLDKDKYFFLPAGKEARKGIIERAQNLKLPTTKTGLFFPKEGHKSASIKKDKKRDEYYIERRGKTKSGVNKGRKYRDVTPITTLDELDKERDRLRRAAKRLGPMKDGEILAFVVIENGVEGYSHNTYPNIERLIVELERYPKNVAARVNFFRHIRIVKSSEATWFSLHPTRSPGKANRKDLNKNPRDTRRSKG